MAVFECPAFDAHESLHFRYDADTGLRAIIAIHSTVMGPAAGGCRMWKYASEAEAIADVMNLSRGMSYKNVMADLPLGGGKAVIIGDSHQDKTGELFEAFGEFVDSLGGRYITAEDVGVNVADMAAAARRTRYVSGLPKAAEGDAAGGDPSPKTARGVYLGIAAAVRHALKRKSLDGVSIAVQGLGGVGYNLCRELHEAGARLEVADIRADRVEQVADEFGAVPVGTDEILLREVDVVAPCALGGAITEAVARSLRARVVAGGANNQLRTPQAGEVLHARGILYAPDYVINAGGIINVAAEYLASMSEREVMKKLEGIAERLTAIFVESEKHDTPTYIVADRMARDRLREARKKAKTDKG